MIQKWYYMCGDIKEVQQALVLRTHLKSESKLGYTQYQEYSTFKQHYTVRNGEENTGCEDPGSGEQAFSYATTGLYDVIP